MLERVEDVQVIMGREESLRLCVYILYMYAWFSLLNGSLNSLLITYVIGNSEMLAPLKVCKH